MTTASTESSLFNGSPGELPSSQNRSSGQLDRRSCRPGRGSGPGCRRSITESHHFPEGGDETPMALRAFPQRHVRTTKGQERRKMHWRGKVQFCSRTRRPLSALQGLLYRLPPADLTF